MRAEALGCVLLCGCGSGWTVATDSLDRVVLSVNGESGDVWVVGGGQGNGAESLVRRLNGGAWESVRGVSGTETLWWVSSGFVVGERGAMYRVDGSALEKLPLVVAATSRRLLMFEVTLLTVHRTCFVPYSEIVSIEPPKPGLFGTSGHTHFVSRPDTSIR